jgi:hypothetical protein
MDRDRTKVLLLLEGKEEKDFLDEKMCVLILTPIVFV